MSNYLPNYCGPHGERFADVCPQCAREWWLQLSSVERALVSYVSQDGVPAIGCKKFIEEFRKMECT